MGTSLIDSVDYSPLDRPEVIGALFFPQKVWSPPPPIACDFMVPVSGGIGISARFYVRRNDSPNILFFHGNGEVASEYDATAPLYLQAGANLFVVDYRGYGRSGGYPSFQSMMQDALQIADFFDLHLASTGFSGPRFVMGRSLGSQSAIQIAAIASQGFAGMIVEGGFTGTERLVSRFGLAMMTPELKELVRLHRAKLQSIKVPVLVIHGEDDEIVPVDAGIDIYDVVASENREVVIIPGASHNDILWTGMGPYLTALRDFLRKHSGTG